MIMGEDGQSVQSINRFTGGQKYYQNYMNDSSDEKSKEYFINTANWLVKHAKEKETNDIDYSLWTYNFPWPFYEG